MNEKLEDLKTLIKSGEYEKAAETLREYRKEFPDDWDGKLMEGVVAQLRGDEETFRHIHDEAQAVIKKHDKDATQIKASPLWRKYRTTWERVATAVVVGIVVGGAVLTSAAMISSAIKDGTDTLDAAMKETKRQEHMQWLHREQNIGVPSENTLYAALEGIEMIKD